MQQKWWLLSFVVAILTLVGVLVSGFGIEQKRQRGGLQITTVNATAAAYLNDTYLNKTPLIEKSLKPGTYTVKLVADDTSMAPFEDQVTVHAGTLSTLTWKPAHRAELSSSVIYQLESLTADQPFWRRWFTSEEMKTAGDLNVVTVPDNAIINLTAQSNRQFAPFVFANLPAGQVDYSVFLPSFETHQHTLDIKAGYRTTAIIKLAKNPPETGENGLTQAATEEQVLGAQNDQSATGSAKILDASSSAKPGEPAVLIKSTGFLEQGEEVLRIRAEPDVRSQTVAMVKVGTRLPFAGESKEGWYKVRVAPNPGWVSQLYAQLENATASAVATTSATSSATNQ